jgi:hypothetical protein
MRKFLSIPLKITILSLPLSLLFTSNAWAKSCTEKEIETYIINKNRPAIIDCGAGAVPDLLKALKKGGTTSEFAGEALELKMFAEVRLGLWSLKRREKKPKKLFYLS